MKLQSKQWMLAAILFASINVSAQTIVPLDENAMYFTADELPDATVWLPAPPDTLSTQFVYDVTQYMWGKTQREDPQRAQQAIDNVVVDVAEMAEQFSVPFGMEISKEKTPAIFHVLYRGMFTARLAARKPKLAYQRLRPYVRFQEPTLIPEDYVIMVPIPLATLFAAGPLRSCFVRSTPMPRMPSSSLVTSGDRVV